MRSIAVLRMSGHDAMVLEAVRRHAGSLAVSAGERHRRAREYATQAERHGKQRRLRRLRARLREVERRLEAGRVSARRGGRRLAGARQRLDGARLSLAADVEGGKALGTETIPLYPDEGWLEMKLPASLACLANRPHNRYRLSCPVEFSYRGDEVAARAATGAAVIGRRAQGRRAPQWVTAAAIVAWAGIGIPLGVSATSGSAPVHLASAVLATITADQAHLSHPVAIAAPAAPTAQVPPAPPSSPGPWRLVWSTNFPVAAPLGSFNAANSDITCTGLPASLQSQWGTYPGGWPDTATESGYTVGGYYDPATTVWISGREMHIKMWRGSTGSVHSAALIPMAAFGKTYGKYVETFRVSQAANGYKSAHLLIPSGNNSSTQNYEIDFPEDEWTGPIYAFVHDYSIQPEQQTFPTGIDWSEWHTTETDWSPGRLSFYLDGKLIGHTTAGVPNVPMNWILQNESSLDPSTPAAPGSSAQMDISYVAYYSYNR